MAAIDSRAAAALKKRVVAILNTASGSCNENSASELRAILDKAGFSRAEVISAGPSEIGDALTRAVADADVLVVLGGDGTNRAAADLCDGGTFLIPLPGGTMNRLPKTVYGERTWQEALADTLAAPQVQDVSGGKAGKYGFFVSALLGTPALWADAREAVRGGHLFDATQWAVTTARRSLTEPLNYAFGDALHGTAEAVAVICPFVSRGVSEGEPMLEAAAFDPKTAREAFRLGLYALFNDWRKDPSVTRAKVKTLQVTGHGHVPVMLDGERMRMGRCVTIRFIPLAFRALRPIDSRHDSPSAPCSEGFQLSPQK
jgi:diacylglycerol kinase family enzyme